MGTDLLGRGPGIHAKTIMDIREKYGPEYFAILLGEPKGMEFHFAQRFGTVYGTPNVFTPGCYCGWQTGMASK